MTEREADRPFIVKPASPDHLVLHPRTFRPIRPQGQDVRADRGYFHRLLMVGDVVMVPSLPPRKEG